MLREDHVSITLQQRGSLPGVVIRGGSFMSGDRRQVRTRPTARVRLITSLEHAVLTALVLPLTRVGIPSRLSTRKQRRSSDEACGFFALDLPLSEPTARDSAPW